MINVKVTDFLTTEFNKISNNELASRAITNALEKPTLVFKNKKLIGAVSFRQALFKRADFTKLKAEKIIENIPIVSNDSYLDDILYLYEESMPKAIAIQQKNRIIGIINSESLFHFLKNKEDVSSLRAGTLSQEPPSFNAKDSITNVVHELRRRNYPYAIVYKQKKYLGVISSKQLAELLIKPLRKERGFVSDTSRTKTTPLKDSVFGNLTIESITEPLPIFSETSNLKNLLSKTSGKYLEFVAPIQTQSSIKLFSPLLAAPILRKITDKKKFRRNIHLTKFPDLDEIDAAIAHNLIDKIYDKLSKMIDSDIMLDIKFKKEQSKGIKTKHRISAHLYYAGRQIQSEATDWNILSGLQRAFDSLIIQTKKTLV